MTSTHVIFRVFSSYFVWAKCSFSFCCIWLRSSRSQRRRFINSYWAVRCWEDKVSIKTSIYRGKISSVCTFLLDTDMISISSSHEIFCIDSASSWLILVTTTLGWAEEEGINRDKDVEGGEWGMRQDALGLAWKSPLQRMAFSWCTPF